jgi:hypothetical protein
MDHKEFANNLRLLADFYEQHPEIKLPWTTELPPNYRVDEKEDAVAVAKACGTFKKTYSNSYFTITTQIGTATHSFTFTREKVCVKKVVGVETIPARLIPAHVEPASTREIVEWECEPLLDTEKEIPNKTETEDADL